MLALKHLTKVALHSRWNRDFASRHWQYQLAGLNKVELDSKNSIPHLLRRSQRQIHGKASPLPHHTLHGNAAIQQRIDNVVANIQPQSIAALPHFGGKERIKNACDVLLGDADAVVAELDLYAPGFQL